MSDSKPPYASVDVASVKLAAGLDELGPHAAQLLLNEYARGRADERAAVVAWLLFIQPGIPGADWLAKVIAGGDHVTSMPQPHIPGDKGPTP